MNENTLDKTTKIAVIVICIIGLLLLIALIVHHISIGAIEEENYCIYCNGKNISHKESEPNLKYCKDCDLIWNSKEGGK